ncbi:ferredoxin [Streptomyces sp. SP17BM10]|uniref:ferredoxin n=1 Tax=Streptomyces sp. SP17BM10 TaxID=3002530 RepID=UPI002E7A8A79|nr:ferredoxin [Streptomyces sp. SP17BM10]MEE1783278.1 ferredoxin [Streptomyces sp. SP17BM10]
MDVDGSIEIDADRCIGAATCTRLAPDVFTQNDDGVVELLPGDAARADDELVREAALGCPVQAITVRES